MPYYVGLDAAKRSTKICVVDENGTVVREGAVESTPKAITSFLRGQGRRYKRVGMESWSLAPWLYVGLAKAGLPIICIEAQHAHALLKAKRPNKTDRNDAKGIAEIMRAGFYKTVHIKSPEAQRMKSVLTAREMLQLKSVDLENGIRDLLLVFGLKLPGGAKSTFARRARKLVGAKGFVSEMIEPILAVRERALEAVTAFETKLEAMATSDPVCRLLMTAPGVGLLTALTYRAAVDEPRRFSRSRDVAAHFGLTARRNQSGESDRNGPITKRGDGAVRKALFLAAFSQMRGGTRPSSLKDWALNVAAKRGGKKGVVALARRMAVVLHRMWITNTEFRWSASAA